MGRVAVLDVVVTVTGAQNLKKDPVPVARVPGGHELMQIPKYRYCIFLQV
jgi:hypothetical protein